MRSYYCSCLGHSGRPEEAVKLCCLQAPLTDTYGWAQAQRQVATEQQWHAEQAIDSAISCTIVLVLI